MSNIDKRALREAAVRAGGVKWQYMRATQHTKAYLTDEKGWTVVNCTDGDVPAKCAGFIESANPATVLALLDELEAKDKSISFLKDQLAQLANFNPDWDKLEAATDSLREHMAELTAARKRIAELERKEQHSDRQSVIDALASSGEEWSDIEEYMQKWDAERASADGKGE